MDGLTMKKTITILLLLPLVAITACNRTEPAASISDVQFSISQFPSFDTKAIGTPDAGKTAWAEGDRIYVISQVPAAPNAPAGQWRITRQGGQWNKIEKYEAGAYTAVQQIEITPPTRLKAYYAPDYQMCDTGMGIRLSDGKYAGAAEFLKWSSGNTFNVTESTKITITFSRDYSRIRVAADTIATTVTLECNTFTPAGASSAASFVSAPVDANGNAFFYGSWTANSTMKFTSYDSKSSTIHDVSLTNRPIGTVGESYALACLSPDTDAFARTSIAGIYDISDIVTTGEVTPIRQVTDSYQTGCLKASASSSFRFQDIRAGELYRIDCSSTKYDVGSSAGYTYSWVSAGTGSLSGTATVVKVKDNMVWMKDTDNNRGYIIYTY